ncbi:MAG: hypothetical protein G01um101431_207 [Parcubacteria group bacterium Gr01-1014_31]|nr:MAG: hypothetical protein G01um101431_207 [Parcubacteria group bacterium Gr01-1014_31]
MHKNVPRAWSVGARLMAPLLALFALVSPQAQAHQDPASCNASGLQQFPSIVSPAGSAYDGDVITYSVIYVNSDPDEAGPVAPCNITGANADITLPNGSVVNVLVGTTLNVGDSISCPGGAGCAAGPYTYTVNHANEVGNSVTALFDIAGILHQDADEEVASDHDTLSKTVIHPSTVLAKQADQTAVVAGTLVTYTYTERNDGDVPLTLPSVVDDMCAPVTGVDVAPANGFNDGDTNANGVLDQGEAWLYTCAMVINADTTNTATGRGLDPNGINVTWCQDPQSPPEGVRCDQDERAQATVRVVSPLVVEKTAETRYDRDWDWTIDKRADQTDLVLAEGESFTVNYAVAVNQTSEDLNHTVIGTITTTNPVGNPNATITGMSDMLDASGAAAVDCTGDATFLGFPHTLVGGQSLVCTYTKNGASPNDTENEATVSTSGVVPGGSDTAAVTWGAPANVTDECITVNDSNPNGPQGVVVCQDTIDKVIEYQVTFGPADGEGVDVAVTCGEIDWPNVARFLTHDTQETGQDDWNVHVTVNCFQGCTLTQGYWKTHSTYGPAAHPDDNWDSVGGPDAVFFLSVQTWYEVFWAAPKGNTYYNLAHQYMAAVLNANNGASVPVDIQTAIDDATALFNAYTPAQVAAMKGNSATRKQFIDLAGILGSYNEGLTGPGHCDELAS